MQQENHTFMTSQLFIYNFRYTISKFVGIESRCWYACLIEYSLPDKEVQSTDCYYWFSCTHFMKRKGCLNNECCYNFDIFLRTIIITYWSFVPFFYIESPIFRTWQYTKMYRFDGEHLWGKDMSRKISIRRRTFS